MDIASFDIAAIERAAVAARRRVDREVAADNATRGAFAFAGQRRDRVG